MKSILTAQRCLDQRLFYLCLGGNLLYNYTLEYVDSYLHRIDINTFESGATGVPEGTPTEQSGSDMVNYTQASTYRKETPNANLWTNLSRNIIWPRVNNNHPPNWELVVHRLGGPSSHKVRVVLYLIERARRFPRLITTHSLLDLR